MSLALKYTFNDMIFFFNFLPIEDTYTMIFEII